MRLKRNHVVAAALGFLLFGPVTSSALELGDATLTSRLGESLVVEIPYRRAAGEQLTPSCSSLVPPRSSLDALPTYTRIGRVSINSTHIQIFGADRILEPLIGVTVDIRCSTAPRFARSYELFVDLPSRIFTAPGTAARAPAVRPALTAAPAAAAREPVLSPPSSSRDNASPRARGRDGGEIAQGETYRVVRGDTLSGIAARIAGRPGTIRDTADAVFAANAAAFTRGNRDLLEAGRSITIPILQANAPQPSVAANAVSAVAPRAIENSAAVDASPAIELPAAVEIPRANETPVAVETPAAVETLPPTAAVIDDAAAAPVPATVDTATAPAAPTSVPSSRTAPWLTALLAVGAIILLSAPFALVRRRRDRRPANQADTRARKPAREPVAADVGIKVFEARLPHTPTANTAATRGAVRATASGLTAELPSPTVELDLPIDVTGAVDIDVGVPVVMEERIDWFGQRAAPANDATAGDGSVELNAVTTRMPDFVAAKAPEKALAPQTDRTNEAVNDEHMTLTIAELDLLREDYEAEHTLTQQGSRALQEAVADLEATKARRAVAAETAELPQATHADTITARVRAK
ncbi:MAG TPA: hypothetical protein VM692_15145 [Gammaproteobacteria bacterium]|nr:hypothetical protein [Gammaproteobacteria bacterium]